MARLTNINAATLLVKRCCCKKHILGKINISLTLSFN